MMLWALKPSLTPIGLAGEAIPQPGGCDQQVRIVAALPD